jgi:hypothetical protein
MYLLFFYYFFYYLFIPVLSFFFGFGAYDYYIQLPLHSNFFIIYSVLILSSLVVIYFSYRVNFFFRNKKIIILNFKYIKFLIIFFFFCSLIFYFNNFSTYRYLKNEDFFYSIYFLSVINFFFNILLVILFLTKSTLKINYTYKLIIILTSFFFINGINTGINTILVLAIFLFEFIKENKNNIFNYVKFFLFFVIFTFGIFFVTFSSLKSKSFTKLTLNSDYLSNSYLSSLKLYLNIHYINSRFYSEYAVFVYNITADSKINYYDNIYGVAKYRFEKIYSKLNSDKLILNKKETIEKLNSDNIYTLVNYASITGTSPGLVGSFFYEPNSILNSFIYLYIYLFLFTLGIERIYDNYKVRSSQIFTQFFMFKFLLSGLMSNPFSFLYIFDETMILFLAFIYLIFFKIKFRFQ